MADNQVSNVPRAPPQTFLMGCVGGAGVLHAPGAVSPWNGRVAYLSPRGRSAGALVPWGCRSNTPQVEGLETTQMHPRTALQPRSSKSRCHEGWFLLEAPEDRPSCLLLASGGCREASAVLGLWTQPSRLCLCLHADFSACPFLSLTRSLSLELGPTLMQCALVLICNPFHLQRSCFQTGHTWRFWWTRIFIP